MEAYGLRNLRMDQTIFYLSLMELNFFGIISLFSIIMQYLAFKLYNKIILQCQDIFLWEFLSWLKIACFKSSILANAHSFILVHNHPSDDQQPTKEDHRITEDMIEAGRLMQIPLKDHVIIGKGWFSFFERECGEQD